MFNFNDIISIEGPLEHSSHTATWVHGSTLADQTRKSTRTQHPFVKTDCKHCPYHVDQNTGIILGMGSANERRRYNVTSSLIGWAHTHNDPWKHNTSHIFGIVST